LHYLLIQSSSVSHDTSEIFLIKLILLLKNHFLLLSMLKTVVLTYLFYLFIYLFRKLNVFLMIFQKKILLTPNFLKG